MALPLLLLPGCGYRAAELYPTQYATIAVPIFENRTAYERAEYALTEALVKELELRTPYKVARPGVADTILQGTITSIEQRQVSRRSLGGVPEVVEVTVTVAFEWRDLRTGQTLRDRRGFEAVGQYIPTSPIGEPMPTALHTAVDRLASEIVSTLQADW